MTVVFTGSRKMKAIREWSLFFKVLTYSGVFPVSFSKHDRIISSPRNKIVCRASFCCQNLIQVAVFYITANKYFENITYEHTYRGMQILQLYSSCITHLLAHTWIFSQKNEILKILLLVIAKTSSTKSIVLKNFKTFQNWNIFYHVNSVLIEVTISILMSKVTYQNIIFLLSSSCHFLLSTLVLTFFTTLVELIEDILRKSNQRLEVIVLQMETSKSCGSQFFELMDIMKTRNDLLLLCSSNISRIFGISLIFISAYVLICVAHVAIFFDWSLSMTDSFSWTQFLIAIEISFYTTVPKLFIFRNAFSLNLRIQVRF